MSEVASILRALADLAPGDTTPERLLDVTGGGDQPFVWVGDRVHPQDLLPPGVAEASLPWRFQEKAVARLHAYDALHREERLLRVGWLFLCGPVRIGGSIRRVCMPLLQRPVRIATRGLQVVVEPVGDTEVAVPTGELADTFDLPYLGDPAPAPPTAFETLGIPARRPVEKRMTPPEVVDDRRVHEWVDRVMAAAGLAPVSMVIPTTDSLQRHRAGDEPVVVGGLGVFVVETPRTTANRGSLLEWATASGIEDSAFAELYGVASDKGGVRTDDGERPEPLPLTEAQRAAVQRARHERISVVSGAPGNGKSHLVCADAIDALARGLTVLVATPTSHAADVLGDLLARQSGPAPVLFGSGGGRRQMIGALEAMGERTVAGDEYDRRLATAAVVVGRRRTAEDVVRAALDREGRAHRSARWLPQLTELRAGVPGAFVPGADLAEVRRRIAAVRVKPSWWRKRALRKLVGSAPIVGVDFIAEAVEASADIRAELELDTLGGTTIGGAWDELLAAEDAERIAQGMVIEGHARHAGRWEGKGRRAVAALLRALPAGRATRRERLAAIDAESLVKALPLWVGTLKDVEDLLPAKAGMFDLVIVDEAAQVDQFRAAGALLRAKRAVVVGDPRQLRHVSFVADAEVAAALERHGITHLADRLDVRRQSLFDVAAGAAPVTFLDEHFRSVPHLIDFSARRFYDGRVLVATRNPQNETEDVIDVLRAPDVAGEVTAAVDLVAQLVAAGQVGIGVVTPFRAQADAIEAALLDRFPPEVIEAHGLRTGTAHSAQGSERDHLVVVLGLAVDDPPARWRFAEDPNLFNVLVTRGRRRLTVVTSLPPDGVPRGIVADYLRHAETPPPALTSDTTPDPWVTALAAELARNGVPTRVAYPVGRWSVDICAGTGIDAVALDCTVHPDGPAAHIARHRALRRAGWRVVDAFASRWDGDAAAAAVELATEFRPDGGPP